MKLLRRFSFLCAAALAALTIILGNLIYLFFEANAVEGVRTHLAEHIGHDARREFSESDFQAPKTGAAYDAFWERLNDILDIPTSLLTVVYAPDGTIIWSDRDDTVGKKTTDDSGLRDALAGKVVAEIIPPDAKDFPFDPSGNSVMKLYVPIEFGDRTRVSGVIKVYQSLDALGLSIRRAKIIVWGVLFTSFLALYVLLFGIVRQGSRLIIRSEDELRASREKIQAQRMELLHRIGTSAQSESGVEPILRDVAADVRRLMDIPRCTIRLYGDPDTIVESVEPGFPSGAGAFPGELRGSFLGTLLAQSDTVAVCDVAAHPAPAEEHDRLSKVRLAAFIASTVRIHDDPAGVLLIESGEPRAWTADETTTAEAAARQLAIAVRHARLFTDQQELAGRLLSLMNNVPGVVYQGLPDWTMRLVGADIERVLGYSAEEFKRGGLKWKDLIHPDDVDAVRARIRDAVRAKEKVLRLEYRMVHRDGSVRWVADRRQSVYDAEGRLAYVDGLCLDITERKRAEEALRLTQFTVDRAPDATYWVAPDGRLMYVNEQTCRVLGYSRQELLGMTIHDINPNYPPEAWADHWDELRRLRSISARSFHTARDGRTIPVEIALNYIEFDGKEYNCATARDISDRLRAEEESALLQTQLLQSQKMEALGILAGGIAHDFNNLLTGILGHADLLARNPRADGDAARVAELIRKAAERASQLTAQLLGFARKGKNLAVPVDVNAAVEDVLVLIGHTIDKSVSIERSLHPGPVVAVGDPTQLRQVIMNLAVNGVESMAGGGTLRMSTGLEVLDEAWSRAHPGTGPGRYVVLEVSDSGVGIPRENLQRIFDPFFTTKEQGKGTGLGLAMVFGIVKNHGGFVDVQSEEGRGTTFRIRLPASGGPAPRAEAETGAALPVGAAKGKILLVDDQEAVRDVCGAMLQTLGYEVMAASDGLEGVARYGERWKEIDLVIVDMIMPAMGGRDCFRRLKEINPGVRAVLSTGYSMEGAVQEIMDEGMLGFIQKPYRLDQLADVVSRVLRGADA